MVSENKNASMFVLPDFKQIQINSFRHFLIHLLPLELKRLGNIKHMNQQFEFQLLGDFYRLENPKYNEREAVYQSTTYASNLYAPVYIADKKAKSIQTQTVLLGTVPLMSLRGTFVINGVSRCIISQLLRSPGIYYTLSIHEVYTATIICNSGKRLKLELDKQGYMWVRFSRYIKIPLVLLLLAMGLDIVFIPEILKNRTKKLEEISFVIEEAMKEICHQLKPQSQKMQIEQPIVDQFFVVFLHPYQLGEVGRSNFNKKLDLHVSHKEHFLRSQDLIAASLYLIQVSIGNGYLDDIDDLRHKRIKCVADVFCEQLQLSLTTLNSFIYHSISKVNMRIRHVSASNFVSANTLTLTRFFASYQLSQFLDQTNPVADIVHKRKLSALGPGGLTPRTARFRVRDIHPSQYGRICPVETAEGQNAGIVTSFTICAEITQQGGIHNPFYEIHTNCMKGRVIHMLPNADECCKIATGRCLAAAQFDVQEQSTAAQHKREFVIMPWDEINVRNILSLHYFSVGVALIPFLEHDDATRALMGSNMQRQAVPLLQPERAIVGTGIEAQISLDSGTVTIASEQSKIQYVDAEKIICINQNIQNKKMSFVKLLTYERSNNSTCIHQTPAVQVGEFVERGQLIADGAATREGEMALGKNILVAYMPWEGYNFEDAVLINERLVHEDVYTSIHIERYDVEVKKNNEEVETITNNIPHLDAHLLRHLDAHGVVCLGAWVDTGDILVGKLTAKSGEVGAYGAENKLLQEIFGIQAISTQESCLKVPPKGGGRVIDIKWITRESNLLGHAIMIQVYISQKRKIQVGDKVAGRHGNKGVVSKIVPRQDMPYLQDGTSVDMILSPLGVPSRMNVGQVFESLLGLAGSFLTKHYRIIPFDERYEKESSRKLVFSELYKASIQKQYPWIFEPDSPGKMKLFDGRTGELFHQPVTIGKAYMLKLIHQVDDKIHARSTGPYALVTQQPVRGRSRKGGQRVGEMEVWAFQGFGGAYVLQELLTTKSDHVAARATVANSIVTGNPVLSSVGVSDCLQVLIRELRALSMHLDHKIVSHQKMATFFSDI